jgi:hypothetical protein
MPVSINGKRSLKSYGKAAQVSRIQARLAGVFYLLTIVVGVFAAFATSRSLSDAGNLVGSALYVIVTGLLYLILKPVSPGLSLIAGLISLAGCAVGALEALHRSPFSFNGIVIFGFYCLLLGYLIYRSGFLPRWLGPLVALAGLGWLTFLWPPFAKHLGMVPMITGLLGEGALTICLLVTRSGTQPVQKASFATEK